MDTKQIFIERIEKALKDKEPIYLAGFLFGVDVPVGDSVAEVKRLDLKLSEVKHYRAKRLGVSVDYMSLLKDVLNDVREGKASVKVSYDGERSAYLVDGSGYNVNIFL